jgi:hypothetical protein
MALSLLDITDTSTFSIYLLVATSFGVIGGAILFFSVVFAGMSSSFHDSDRRIFWSQVRWGVGTLLMGVFWPLLPLVPLYWILRGFLRISGVSPTIGTWWYHRQFQAEKRKEQQQREHQERQRQERLERKRKEIRMDGALSLPQEEQGMLSLCDGKRPTKTSLLAEG